MKKRKNTKNDLQSFCKLVSCWLLFMYLHPIAKEVALVVIHCAMMTFDGAWCGGKVFFLSMHCKPIVVLYES